MSKIEYAIGIVKGEKITIDQLPQHQLFLIETPYAWLSKPLVALRSDDRLVYFSHREITGDNLTRIKPSDFKVIRPLTEDEAITIYGDK